MEKRIRSPGQLGALVHNERVRRGMSQQALADHTGIGQKTISRIENGKDGTKLETIFNVLAALDLELRLAARDKQSDQSVGDLF